VKNISLNDQKLSAIQLDTALDRSIVAANALHLTDTELVTKLLEHLQNIDSISGKIVDINCQSGRKMFNPLAGP